MSLVKKPTMSKKRLETLAKSRKNSHGPSTAAGRERIRAANLRHGFYSKSDEVALRALGEDPAQFRTLLEELGNPRTVGKVLQEGFARRLARSFWRVERAERMQDGYALRQAQEEQAAREGRLHVKMMRLKVVARSWQLLAQAVARPLYITTNEHLRIMRDLHKEGVAKEMSEVAVSLFYQLREPGRPCPGDPDFVDDEEKEQQRQVLMRIKDIFGLNNPPPDAPTPAEARQSLREASGRQDVGAAAADGSAGPDPAGPEVSADATSPDAGAAAPVEGDEVSEAESAAAESIARFPNVTPEQWGARGNVRQLLQNILTRQVETFDAQHRELMRQLIAGPSPHERAAEIVPNHPHTEVVRRMEDAGCRQLLRMTDTLIRLRRQELQLDKIRKRGVSRDV